MLFLRQTDEPKGLPKKRVRTDFDLSETPLRMRIKRSLFAKKTVLNKRAKGTLRGNLHHKKLNQRLNNQRLNNQKKSSPYSIHKIFFPILCLHKNLHHLYPLPL